jgi:thioesterase domain-containing protein/acyl carrier protein
MNAPSDTRMWWRVNGFEAGGGRLATGRPIANTTTFVVDPHGQSVPVGVPGELLIGGAGVADGYRHRAKLTAERFVTSSALSNQRLYRTGDLARYRPDGVIECLGRTDNQVKVRGFRVEPEEIEAHLLRHSEIAAAAVKAWPDSSGEMSLAGYIVARAEPAPSAADLRQFLRQTLPDYMVPSRFVALSSLPMTPNRKVDRNALPESKSAPQPLVFAEPNGDTEHRLAAVWKDVLGIVEVGAHDNFFDLGGHSLLVTRLIRRIEQEFGTRLPMAATFNKPTLRALAALIGDAESGKDVSRTVAFHPKGSKPPLFWINGGANFHELAETLGPDQPFIDVPLDLPAGADIDHPPRFEDVATDMVSAIRAVQPHGPYHLGGWCTAGILAFEIATQLRAQGETVSLLALAHTTNPVYFRKLTSFDIELSKFKLYTREFLRLHPREMGRFAFHRILGIIRRVNEPWLPKEVRQPEDSRVLDRSAMDYVPKQYMGDVVLFQPDARPDIYDHWPAWVDVMRGKFSTVDLPGDHQSMLHHPNVSAFAARLNNLLGRAQAPVRSVRKAG